MADNVSITPGSGAVIGADSCTVNSVANVLVSLGKLGFGGNDQFTYVSSTAGLPVAQQGTWTVAIGAALPAGTNVIGHVVVDSLPAVTGTVAISGTVAVASVGGTVEIANDVGNPIPVSGTVTVGNASLAVTQSSTWTVGLSAGTNVIGHVIVDSLPAIPAGTNTIGTVNAIQAGDSVEIGGTTYAVLKAFVNATIAGDTTVQAGTAGKKIRVLAYSLSAGAAVNVFFKGSSAGPLCSTKYLAGAGAGYGKALATFGHFADTAAGDNLLVNLSGVANVGVDILYILI